jgi:hypothetical protein
MVRKIIISKSKRKGKRLRVDMLDFPDMDPHSHHFGSSVGKTFIDGVSDKVKSNWIARFSTSKSWDNIHSPLYFSRKLLWETNDWSKNIRLLSKELKATIIDRTK